VVRAYVGMFFELFGCLLAYFDESFDLRRCAPVYIDICPWKIHEN
jgi:hypothetical protein